MQILEPARHLYDRPDVYEVLFAPSEAEVVRVKGWIQTHWGSRPARILDPACGTGFWLRALSGEYVAGCDISTSMVRWASDKMRGRNARVTKGNMTSLPFEAGEFDVLVNLEGTVGHLHSYDEIYKHLREARRVMSNEGVYFLGVPFSAEPGELHNGSVAFDSGLLNLDPAGAARVILSYVVPEESSGRYSVRYRLELEEGGRHQIESGDLGIRPVDLVEIVGAVEAADLQVRGAYYTSLPGCPFSQNIYPLGQATLVLTAALRPSLP